MKKLSCLLILFALASFMAAAWAQQNAAGVGERLFPMVGRVLTVQQRQSFQQILEAQRAQIRPLVEKLQASRQAMLNQAFSGNFNEGVVRQYAAQSANAEADLSVIFAKALSQMQPPLSAQQIAQLKNSQMGRFRQARNGESDDEPAAVPAVHLKLPPPLPTDTNGLPVVN
jgi:Spy/CpxP family protein refolding chaperone